MNSPGSTVRLVFYTNALHQFATTRAEVPVVTGAYKLSRHPMQVFSLIMWLGVGIATTNHIILLICLLQPFLMKPFLKSQERFCLTHYGQPYQAYLQQTPRYLFLV
jgi:protein-S-isoprenylcysteine O-methyltransferase Ste14